MLSLTLVFAAIHTIYASPMLQTAAASEHHELILHPSLPSLASLNITLADILTGASSIDSKKSSYLLWSIEETYSCYRSPDELFKRDHVIPECGPRPEYYVKRKLVNVCFDTLMRLGNKPCTVTRDGDYPQYTKGDTQFCAYGEATVRGQSLTGNTETSYW
jgi:hypothetical protein